MDLPLWNTANLKRVILLKSGWTCLTGSFLVAKSYCIRFDKNNLVSSEHSSSETSENTKITTRVSFRFWRTDLIKIYSWLYPIIYSLLSFQYFKNQIRRAHLRHDLIFVNWFYKCIFLPTLSVLKKKSFSLYVIFPDGQFNAGKCHVSIYCSVLESSKTGYHNVYIAFPTLKGRTYSHALSNKYFTLISFTIWKKIIWCLNNRK